MWDPASRNRRARGYNQRMNTAFIGFAFAVVLPDRRAANHKIRDWTDLVLARSGSRWMSR